MAKKTEPSPGPTQSMAGRDGAVPAQDRGAVPEEPRPARRKVERGELRNPLGDFSEQIGAFFG